MHVTAMTDAFSCSVVVVAGGQVTHLFQHRAILLSLCCINNMIVQGTEAKKQTQSALAKML